LKMSKLQKYPKYKDSGIEWIGEIPEHWRTVKIKHLLYEKKKAYNTKLRCGSISFGKVVYKDDKKIPIETKKAYQVVERGNFLVNPLNLNYDLKSLRIALSELDVVVSSGYIVLDTSRDIEKRYLNYLLHRFDVAFMKTLGAGVRQTLNYNDISVCQLVEPPKNEQIQIAEYLDKKTEKIDKLISIKEKLIKRLKEQRQIIINNAVTKGLNPNVKMKDSGIEWIGEIPEHWEVRKFRFYFDMTKGLNITKADLKNYGIPCINYGEIHSKYPFEVIPEINNLKCVNETYLQTSSQSLLNKGDFVFADTSEDIEGSGNFTYLNSDTNIFAGYHTIIARLKSKLSYRFFAYYFDSLAYRKYIRKNVKGVKVYSITNAILKESKLLIPPQEEQIQIAEHLDKKTAQIDKAIKFQEEQIKKLKEYKTTLIDSVVTGKVRICDG